MEDNRKAIDTALALLGKRCGFRHEVLLARRGRQPQDGQGGRRRATPMRNAKKHEQAVGAHGLPAGGKGGGAREPVLWGGPAGRLRQGVVLFGDTIIQDEDTERERMRADVAAGLMPAWKYTQTYYGVSAETG
ncbi:MAG: hypothetical protein V8S24_07245 [Gordonibacter pamelaeae]